MNINLRRILTHRLFRCNAFAGQVIYNKCIAINNSRNYSVDLSSYSSAFFKLSQSIANSSIVESTKTNLITFHDWSCIPWSLEIAIITICFRSLVTFPLGISQQKILAKFESLKPEMEVFARQLKRSVDDEKYLYNYSTLKAKLRYNYLMKKEHKRLIIRDNCHPMKASIVLWFQIPFWVILSHTIRNLSFMYPIADEKALTVYNQLSNEGILWFNDLTQTDPYYVLPFIVAFVNLANVQFHANERLKKLKAKTSFHTTITNFGRILSVAIIPIGLYMPSSVCFYWLISSTTGLVQNLIIYNDKFKQLIGIQIKLQNQSSIQSIKS